MSKRKLSNRQLRVLLNLAAGRDPAAHCNRQSDWAGLQGTVDSLLRQKLVEQGLVLTDAGRQVLKSLGPRTLKAAIVDDLGRAVPLGDLTDEELQQLLGDAGEQLEEDLELERAFREDEDTEEDDEED